MANEKASITVALAGNPNAGKTTIFNALTGSQHHVGNWPGVTVERKEGHTSIDDHDLTIVDLPGTYSLTAYSIEEIVARRYIVHNHPDVVVHIIDSGNLERNLYLTTQLLELGCKVVIALNMFDSVKDKGAKIDVEKLGSLLGAPAVPTVGTSGEGIQELKRAILQVAQDKHPLQRRIPIPYGHEIEEHIENIQSRLEKLDLGKSFPHDSRWAAVKLLENDSKLTTFFSALAKDGPPILSFLEKERTHLASIFKEDIETILTERRYGFIAGVIRETYTEPPMDRISMSDKVDTLLTHKYLGLPVFFLMIWGIFQATFAIGAYPMEWIEMGVGWLAETLSGLMGPSLLKQLIVDGAINGVGSVLVFLPNIFILFFCISFLEDSGYMARAAFLTDRVMHMLGLHGKAFIPMLMGFGCNVPAIMATRTLESERDRILAILINPLISCSARLPVYILLAGAFFKPDQAGTVIFSIYMLGLVLAIAMGKLFSKTILPGEAAPFVMELPPYRMPTFKSSMIHTWSRGKLFLKKMGGVILIGSIVIWGLSAFPRTTDYSMNYDAALSTLQQQEQTEKVLGQITDLETAKEKERLEASYIARIGKVATPVFSPLGFEWQQVVALGTGLVAKEIVVSTFGVLYQVGEEEDEMSEGLRSALRNTTLTPLHAFALMAFILIYTPCLGTLAAIRRETNSYKWMFFSIGYGLALAWLVAFVIVQGGGLIGLG